LGGFLKLNKMKVTENVTVYQCEHCGKKLFRKHAMIKHEELCNNNHKNYKACMAGCAFLEKTQILRVETT
jgi:uncharacterized radical SAM superfamily protein